jgi:hypothetical protein
MIASAGRLGGAATFGEAKGYSGPRLAAPGFVKDEPVMSKVVGIMTLT